MADLNQYGLDVVKVSDLASALAAIEIVLQQGEGLFAPPDYVKFTHYCLFSEALRELEEQRIDVARPVVRNPLVSMHPDITAPDEVTLLTNEYTREVADVANRTYETMLELLATLYGDWNKSTEDAQALTDAVFFPIMTMFVRPLGEALTQMPAFPSGDATAGPGFEIYADRSVVVAPPPSQIWIHFLERFAELVAAFDRLGPWLAKSADPRHARFVPRLAYMTENMRRLFVDWREHWTNIGRDSNMMVRS